jgi:hypothetical protein
MNAAMTAERIGKARANTYFVDCPVPECNGYLTVPETGSEQWTPDDFKRGAVGHCDECDRTFKVRR